MIYIDKIYSNYFKNMQNYVFTPVHITKKLKVCSVGGCVCVCGVFICVLCVYVCLCLHVCLFVFCVLRFCMCLCVFVCLFVYVCVCLSPGTCKYF